MKKFYKAITGILFLASVLSLQGQSYCMLPGRTPYHSMQPGIINFKLNKVNRTSSNVESPSSVIVSTGLTDSLVRSQVYTVTIVHSWDSVYFTEKTNNIRIYVDLNQDWDFTDPGETVLNKNIIPAGTFTGTFVIPSTAALGITGMRVTAKMSQELGHTAPTPCDEPADQLGYHGEIEDYWIDVAREPNLVGLQGDETTLWKSHIYPNPVQGILNLAINGSMTQSISVDLLDLTGKKIACLVENKDLKTNGYSMNLNVGAYEKGIYFLRLSSGDTSVYHKIAID